MTRFENMPNDQLTGFRREIKNHIIQAEDRLKYLISELLVIEEEVDKRRL